MRTLLLALAVLIVPQIGSANLGKWFSPPNARVFIEQRGSLVQIQEPDFHMAAARRAFESGRAFLAAEEIERAAGGVAFMAERAAGLRKKRLWSAHAELRELRRAMRSKELESTATLDRVFRATQEAMQLRRG